MTNEELQKLPWPNIRFIPSTISGCFEILPPTVSDTRGSFSKIFHRPLWESLGLCIDFQEEYITHSIRNVVRGLHFQVPPMQHTKVVLCLQGSAFDVALDLRQGSPTYGEYASYELSGDKANAVYLSEGIAHGFCSTSDDTVLYYKQSTIYSPEQDHGIFWNSAGISWPITSPLLSERDQRLQSFANFDSPFVL